MNHIESSGVIGVGSRVALLSGGKDSLYAAIQHWPPDYGLILDYKFPVPSPHLLNLGSSVKTLLLTGIPIIVARLAKGREREDTISVLKKLEASELIAGDVYIEDHLNYMEGIASDVGAVLREPLWGRDPEELTYEIYEGGFTTMIIGVKQSLLAWIGKEINSSNLEEFIESANRRGIDPLGEKGEYHTLVLHSPVHKTPLQKPGISSLENHLDSWILRLQEP